MEKKVSCSMCEKNSEKSACCAQWCPGCLLHKILRILIIVVALTVAFSFGEKVGMIQAWLLNDSNFYPQQGMMYRNNDNWGRGNMMYRTDVQPQIQVEQAPTTAATPTTAPTKTPTKTPLKK
ncbi:MAG: hypothetical protein WCQ32_03050 [bacterium]